MFFGDSRVQKQRLLAHGENSPPSPSGKLKSKSSGSKSGSKGKVKECEHVHGQGASPAWQTRGEVPTAGLAGAVPSAPPMPEQEVRGHSGHTFVFN